MVLLIDQLQQWRGLCQSNYAVYLFKTATIESPYNVSYPTIKNHVDTALELFKSAEDKINTFEQTVDFLDYIQPNESGGLDIQFRDFSIECMDFYVLKWNFYQNYGSTLISTLPSLPIDLYPTKHQGIEKGCKCLRNALQILRDFSLMIKKYEEQMEKHQQRIKSIKEKHKKSRRRTYVEISSSDEDYDENDNDVDQENNPISTKLNPHKLRIPETFFDGIGIVQQLDSNKDGEGFKQYLLDRKMKTYFELAKAYIILNRISDADKIYDEAICELLERSNHGQQIQGKILPIPGGKLYLMQMHFI